MPKTKDAFALRGLYDDLIRCEQERANATPETDPHDIICENWIYPTEEYLNKIIPKKVDLEKKLRKKGKSKLYGLCLLYNVSRSEDSERATQAANVINAHIKNLQTYSAKLFDKILVEGVTDNLKHKADRVKILIKCYQYIQDNFDDYAEAMERSEEDDEKKFNKSIRQLFGERLQQARQRKNLSILEIANRLKMSRTGYRYYELGQRDLPTPTICRIALLLDVSLDWLFGLTD